MNDSKTDRRLGVAVAVLSLIGLGIAGYLAYVHYADKHIACLVGGGCETVQASRYAKFAGIPVPTLGVFGYLTILASLAIPRELGRGFGMMAALAGFGFSMYLTWLELVRIKAICQWCVGSAVVMTLLAIVTTWRFWVYESQIETAVAGGSDSAPEPADSPAGDESGEDAG